MTIEALSRPPEGLKILGVEIQNFKRIEVASIRPDGSVMEITGRNEQGKSSILDAIEAALGGKRRQPEEPIRRGAEGSYVVVDLGEFAVKRTWTAKSDRLVVTNSDGAIYPKAQSKLNELIGAISFDPLEFMTLSPSHQREVLLAVIGVDLDGIETRRKDIYEQRRDVGRDLRSAEQRLADVPEIDAPDEEVSIQALSSELSEVLEKAAEIREGKSQAKTIYLQSKNEMDAIENDLEKARRKVEQLEEEFEDARSMVRETSRAFEAIRDQDEPSADEIRKRMAEAEEINRKVRDKKHRNGLVADLELVQEKRSFFDQKLEQIEAEKAGALEGAEMPVAGLAISDEGVTFEGIPLSQASMSRRVRVCTAISAALNPKLRIALVRAGNDLDDQSLAEFYAFCEEAGLQAWVERINGIGEDALVIEEGRIVGANADAEEDAA